MQGRATLTGPKSLKVAGASGETELQFEHLILATGSHPTKIPSLSLDSPRMMDSTSGLELPDVPKSLLVIGGGYIGLELGIGLRHARQQGLRRRDDAGARCPAPIAISCRCSRSG